MSISLGHHLQGLHPQVFEDASVVLGWPPDVFALVAHVLKVTGAYLAVLQDAWPTSGLSDPLAVHGESWEARTKRVGAAWRATSLRASIEPPPEIQQWWGVVREAKDMPIEEIARGEAPAVVTALVALLAAADEACEGVGGLDVTKGRDADHNEFLFRARMMLASEDAQDVSRPSSLARIPNPQVAVLPKRHTPRSGITLRSLTHHLALVEAMEVTPRYWSLPFTTSIDPSFQILLAPWPLHLAPASFKPHPGNLDQMPSRFRFVAFDRKEDPDGVSRYLRSLIDAAREINPQLHLVVFPELALTEREWIEAASIAASKEVSIIAGVASRVDPEAPRVPPCNQVRYQVSKSSRPLADGGGRRPPQARRRVKAAEPKRLVIEHVQDKHHRWQIDANQIRMYGLGGTLDVNHDYWEYIALEPRVVNFTSISRDLMFCCLICEDLARQDPVAEMLRSVGPNLVLALLMDGPQLSMRWSARYATVLAEDPGSSVLTFTCAGMVALAQPPPGAAARRTVALWKEAGSTAFREIDLPDRAHGMLLSLTCVRETEFTADGRSDHGTASNPRLTAIHPVISSVDR